MQMVNIIGPGRSRGPSIGQRLSAGLGRGLDIGSRMFQEHQAKQEQAQALEAENEAAKRLGLDLSGIKDPKMRQKAFELSLLGQQKERGFAHEKEMMADKLISAESEKGIKEQQNLISKIAPLQGGIEVLNRMRMLRNRGNLGFGSSIKGLISPETRQDRGEYEQLGKSLISLATNIPIRNQQEFQTLAENLYDPSITDAQAKGILDAMERIISNSMRQFQGADSIGAINPSQQAPQKERPPLSSFHR